MYIHSSDVLFSPFSNKNTKHFGRTIREIQHKVERFLCVQTMTLWGWCVLQDKN